MFTINEKNYNENDLSDKARMVFNKLMRLGEQKADLDIVINYWTSKLQAELPKEAVDDNTITEE